MKTLLVEYIWIDGDFELRSKNRTIKTNIDQLDTDTDVLQIITPWNYDGSSTAQAVTKDSEVILKPIRVVKDPFSNSKYPSYLALCETFDNNDKPLDSNTRALARKVFDDCTEEYEPWFGLEQEFFVMDCKTRKPYGHQSLYSDNHYCQVGGKRAVKRNFVQKAYEYALDAGLTVSGMNAEVAPGQWEIQVGPVLGIHAADELCLLRYILHRTSEEFKDLYVDLSAKPIEGENGSGCHCNFSTKNMRKHWTHKEILLDMEKLRKHHKHSIKVYGKDNKDRLVGKYETSSFDEFSWGYGSRNTSVRVPNQVQQNGRGYLEDRRPSSSCDPYLVTSTLCSFML